MVDDTVSLFGNDLKVRGVPFCEQDGEYLRCAHAAAWVCHYVAVRRDLVGQRSTSHIVSFIPPSEERAIPSKGLRIYQLQAVFGELGQPALLYSFDDLPDVNGVQRPAPEIDPKTKRQRFPGYWDTRAISIICRYLNSGFPVLVAAAGHAIALVGWYRKDGSLRFIACDDQVGPYEEIESPFSHYKAPWHGIMVPLPPKVFLTGEAAENAGFNTLRAIWASNSASVPLADALDDQRIQLRARLKNVRAFKREVAEQTSSEEVLRAVRLARLPHFVWVVEAHLRHACGSGPCVLGTVLFDATSSDYEPRICMIAAPGVVAAFSPDGAAPDIVRGSHAPWHSMLSAH